MRVATYTDRDDVHILFATARSGMNESIVDNFGAGGVSVAVDWKTGKIIADAIDQEYRRIATLPMTGTTLQGFQIPNWGKALDVVRRAARLAYTPVSYTHLAVAPRAFYDDLVAFARKYSICVVHDNAYSEIVFDGNEGLSFLSVPGAMDVGVEFNSLSKTYDLTGARLSFLLGNKAILERFRALRTQIDYGLFYVAQRAAIAALDGPQELSLIHLFFHRFCTGFSPYPKF